MPTLHASWRAWKGAKHEHPPGGQIILYQCGGDTPAINVRLDGDTVWLSQQQLADLFQTSRTNVVEHIANIYAEGELNQESTCREFRQVRIEGTREVSRTLRMPVPNPVAQENAQTFMARVAQINTSQCPACAHGRLRVIQTCKGHKRLPDPWACKAQVTQAKKCGAKDLALRKVGSKTWHNEVNCGG